MAQAANGAGGRGQGGEAPGYEDAVKAASWAKLEGAPSVVGGRKQDDIFFLDAETRLCGERARREHHRHHRRRQTWAPVFTSDGTFFRALLFLDEQHGFAGNLGAGLVPSIDDPNVLYETTDGGTNWAAVTSISGPAPAGICNLTAIDDSHIVGVGRANGPSHMVMSSDAGATWTSLDLGQWLTMPIDVHFTSPTEGIVAGMGGNGRCTIIRTTDGGTSFENVFVSDTAGSLCWKLDFPSDTLGFVRRAGQRRRAWDLWQDHRRRPQLAGAAIAHQPNVSGHWRRLHH